MGVDARIFAVVGEPTSAHLSRLTLRRGEPDDRLLGWRAEFSARRLGDVEINYGCLIVDTTPGDPNSQVPIVEAWTGQRFFDESGGHGNWPYIRTVIDAAREVFGHVHYQHDTDERVAPAWTEQDSLRLQAAWDAAPTDD